MDGNFKLIIATTDGISFTYPTCYRCSIK